MLIRFCYFLVLNKNQFKISCSLIIKLKKFKCVHTLSLNAYTKKKQMFKNMSEI